MHVQNLMHLYEFHLRNQVSAPFWISHGACQWLPMQPRGSEYTLNISLMNTHCSAMGKGRLFFFKSARNVFNEEEVNYDNYSEWSDPWALLISIYCLDYRTIQVKPNCDCSFTLKTWKGNGGSSLQPPPWGRVQSAHLSTAWRLPPCGITLIWSSAFPAQSSFCVRLIFAWTIIVSGDWWQEKHFGYRTIWGQYYQLRELSNKELKCHAP